MNKKSKSTLDKLSKILRVRNYSEQTIKSYCGYVKKFLLSYDEDVYHIPISSAKKYLQDYNYSSVSQQNSIISSIKFLYKEVVGRKLNNLNIVRPRKKTSIPQIIDKHELKRKILVIHNKKHKAILSLAYSTGMRVSEIINLKIKYIDSKRMVILVKNGKGDKDRYVPLSNKILSILREYYKEYKPVEYLFNGQFKNQYSYSSCNNLMKRYIKEDSHFHQLRHSSFTALLESGVDIRVIQKIAGHNNVKTTEIYTHVSNDLLNQVELPI